MTRTREENARDEMQEALERDLAAADRAARARLRGAADAEIAQSPGLIPEGWEDYEDWLAATGRDDSFVGDDISIPGTADLYAAAMRVVEARQFVADNPDLVPVEPLGYEDWLLAHGGREEAVLGDFEFDTGPQHVYAAAIQALQDREASPAP